MNRGKKIAKLKAKDQDKGQGKKESKFELDNKLILKAAQLIRRLSEASREQSNNLFELSKHSFVYVNVVVNALPSEKNIKPVHIELPSSILGARFSTKHVLIVTNEFKLAHKEALRGLKENWKFISYDKISKDRKQYKDKLALLKDFDMFFCEGRIYMLLKKHLGKHFYEHKRYPYPVNLDGFVSSDGSLETKGFKNCLNSLIERSTYFVQGNGPEYSLKVGRTDKLSDLDLVKNVRAGVKGLIKVLMERGIKLGNVRRIIMKGEKTDSFPIYSHLTPEEKKLLAKIVSSKPE